MPEPDGHRGGAGDGNAVVRPASTALPPTSESLLPWLGAAAVVAVVTLGAVILGEDELASVEITTLLVGLCATLAVAGLVAARSGTVADACEREERARPARDQLPDLDDGVEGPGSRSYLEGMERWTVALLDLVAHAVEATTDAVLRRELTSASEDTDALRALLQTTTGRQLGLNEVATLHSVCALWETNQDRIERLAAEVDPAWHRRWRARSVIARLLRHGPPQQPAPVLPYRS